MNWPASSAHYDGAVVGRPKSKHAERGLEWVSRHATARHELLPTDAGWQEEGAGRINC